MGLEGAVAGTSVHFFTPRFFSFVCKLTFTVKGHALADARSSAGTGP